MASPLWRLGLISLFLLVNPTSTNNFHLPSSQSSIADHFIQSSSSSSPADCKDFRFEEPCACFSQSNSETTQYILNCDQVAFRFFPPFPTNVSFLLASFQRVGYQGLPTELFSNRNSTLRALDLSQNFLLSITTNSLAGLENTLEYLNLAHNSLGRNFQPVLDIPELLRLRVLRSLDLSSNGIKLFSPPFISGLSETLEELYLAKNDLIDVEFLKNAKNLRQLKFLDVSENRLFRLESFSFSALPALQYVDLTDNFLTMVLPNAFNGSALKQIGLSQNRLANVDSSIVAGLEKTLAELDLSFNALKKFPDIGSLDLLEKLNLSSNMLENPRGISTLPDSTLHLDLSSNLFTSSIVPFLSQLPSLKTLHLSRNFIGDAWVDSTFAIPTLEHLVLGSTNMTAFPAGILSAAMPRLRSLDVSYNLINTLPTEIFANASLLIESLTMSHCNIQAIDPEIWNDVPNLRFLDLSYNLLPDVPNLPKSLYELNLKHNRISSLLDLRNGLPNLVNLTMAENSLPSIDWTLLPMQTLRNLDLSKNNLTEFPGFQAVQYTEQKDFAGVVRMMPSIDGAANSWKDLASTVEVLDLSRNQIGNVKEPLSNFPNLTVLDLSRNQIQTIPATFLQDFVQLKAVNLSGNHLSGLAEGTFVNLPQLADIDFSFNNLADLPAQFFIGADSQMTIRLNGNRFTTTASLNFTSLPSLTTLSLSQNQIVNLTGPAFSGSSIQHLDLSENLIVGVDNATFRMMSSLRTLNLQSNRIGQLPPSAFWGTLQLQDLDLSYNVIESFPEDLFRGVRRLTLNVAHNNLKTLPDHIFSKPRVDRLIDINLSSNSFNGYPEKALGEQEYNLIALDISHNNISTIPSGYLISVKRLDVSSNPLSDSSIRTLLSDPKATFKLNLANTGLTVVPPILLQFLTSLNISNNNLTFLSNMSSWEHVTLLENLDVSGNILTDLKDGQISLLFPKLSFLKSLNLSANPVKSIRAHELSGLVNVDTLDISSLPNLETFDISNLLELPRLRNLRATNYPRLSNFPVGDISPQLPLFRNVHLELHSPFITNQLHGIITPSLRTLFLSGPTVTRISKDAFNGFLPPAHFALSLNNMSISSVPSEVLRRFPRDTQLKLRVSGTELTERDMVTLVTQLTTENPMVVLSNNRLTCTCQSALFFRTVDGHIQCDLPAGLKDIPVSRLNSSVLNCDQSDNSSTLQNSFEVVAPNEVNRSINPEQLNDTNTSVIPTLGVPVVPLQLQPETLPLPGIPTNKWPFNWYATKPSSEPEVIFEITTSKPSTAASNYMLEGAVAGIVVGLVVLTALIIGGIVFWFRREKRRQLRQFAAQNEGHISKEKPYAMIPNPDICPHPSWYPPPQPVFVIPVPVTSTENGGLNQEYLNSVREMYYNRDYLKNGQKFLEYPAEKKGHEAQERLPVDFGNESDYPRESVDLTDHTDEETDDYSVLESCDMTFTYESVFDTGQSVPSIDDSLYEHR
ncbi:hypothetical protein RvY_16598 [Ramazzottius varieornatus]|uniref:LRRCT domain-containing protein n=1 Tax=Ramazzottius varieornatus TaxID=947166 RepID=A0A1D1VZ20_RAMVA|nr:hypothetical protein RvY_16598 [Ramazzottius varieornatus]